LLADLDRARRIVAIERCLRRIGQCDREADLVARLAEGRDRFAEVAVRRLEVAALRSAASEILQRDAAHSRRRCILDRAPGQRVRFLEKSLHLERADLDVHRLRGEIAVADLERQSHGFACLIARRGPVGQGTQRARDVQLRECLVAGRGRRGQSFAKRFERARCDTCALQPQPMVELRARRADRPFGGLGIFGRCDYQALVRGLEKHGGALQPLEARTNLLPSTRVPSRLLVGALADSFLLPTLRSDRTLPALETHRPWTTNSSQSWFARPWRRRRAPRERIAAPTMPRSMSRDAPRPTRTRRR